MQTRIIKHENKTGQSGKDYTAYDTSKGRMNCFDKTIIEELNQCEGREVSIDITENRKGDITYKNIIKFNGLVAPGFEEEIETVEVVKMVEMVEPKPLMKTPKTPVNGNKAMYVSYAKDIFIAMLATGKEPNMEGAIHLVKQAQESFS